MYARSIDLAATANPVVLSQKLEPGWYCFRCAYDPATPSAFGGLTINLATSNVSNKSMDQLDLRPGEAMTVMLKEPVEVRLARAEGVKARLHITEV